ncbi:MAG: hypothetical protein F6K40_19750 [Okeania sp. SIO3I5]|uniref:hypothetical protein n=1 Tax=Okeania sp. SIO3I5 TaxID=2607805 RepID=UPI0013BC5717|nr:hypothetical protein [Okeania sp. SIO3I5]NEQ38378.1 hypothetical protein [Okeania sp. SIO3I5]
MKSNSKNYESDGNERVDRKSPHPFLLALILTGILTAEAYPNLTETAIAAVKVLKYPQVQTNGKITSKADKFANLLKFATDTQVESQIKISEPFFLSNKSLNHMLTVQQTSINENFDDVKKFNKPITEEPEKLTNQSEKIPNDIVDAVCQNLASQIGIAPEKIKVSEVTQETWPNTCLGLPKNDELCGLRLVEGWRLVLSNGKEKWVYRTDNLGKLMRVEPKK